MSTDSTFVESLFIDTLRESSGKDEMKTETDPSSEDENDTTAQQVPEVLKEVESELGGTSAIEYDDASRKAEPSKPRFSYRIEYRDRQTNQLLSHRTQDEKDKPDFSQIDGPIFEAVTCYKILADANTNLAFRSLSLPTYSLRISSIALINAIHSVVRYYPGQDLSGEYISIPWPYPILVHHYDELQQFRHDCLSKPHEELCVREKDAPEHIRILLEYLDEEVMGEVRKERERNRAGVATYDWRWLALKPGVTMIKKDSDDAGWDSRVIHSVTGGTLTNPPSSWSVRSWNLNYVDGIVRRVWSTDFTFFKFDGERFDDDFDDTIKFIDPTESDEFRNEEGALELIKSGEKYAEMLEPKYFQHRGEDTVFSQASVSALQLNVSILSHALTLITD